MPFPLRFVVPALTLAVCSLLTSCSSNGLGPVAVSPALAGNWSFRATAKPATSSQIDGVGGSLAVSSNGAISGMLHTLPVVGVDKSALCYASTNAIPVTGSLGADNTLTLTSSDFAGNALVVRGTYVAAKGTTPSMLTNATYSITGPCGVAAQAVAALAVPVLSGTYTGTALFGTNAVAVPYTATFSQASTPNTAGTYTITGTASFGSDPCVFSPVSTSLTVLDNTAFGDFLSVTYQDSVTNTIIIAQGTSTDFTGNTLNMYSLALVNGSSGYGQCNDAGSATLTKSGS